jgi:hypothetical protein
LRTLSFSNFQKFNSKIIPDLFFSLLADPPVFLKGLTNQEIKDGEELILKVKVTGTPKPKLAWTKDDAEIAGEIVEEDGAYTLSYEKAGVSEMGQVSVTRKM